MPQKPIFGEHLHHKPMESVFAHIRKSYHHETSEKYQAAAILHNSLQLGTKGAWLRSRDPLLNFGTPVYLRNA